MHFDVTDYLDKIKKAAEYIRKNTGDDSFDAAAIFGSGLHPDYDAKKIISYTDIPFFPTTTIAGHEGLLSAVEIYGKKFLNFSGRFHYYEGYTPQEITFPVRLMKELGVKTLILTNAAGSINNKIKTGDLMLIEDHINLTGTNPLIGPNIDRQGQRFVNMSHAYSRRLNKIALKTGKCLKLKTGTYIGVSGPTYETNAEINFFKKIGADAVGMSTVFESIAAAHCGIETMGISCIVNSARDSLKKPVGHEGVIDEAAKITPSLLRLIDKIIKHL